jgi:hypothetical protein
MILEQCNMITIHSMCNMISIQCKSLRVKLQQHWNQSSDQNLKCNKAINDQSNNVMGKYTLKCNNQIEYIQIW